MSSHYDDLLVAGDYEQITVSDSAIGFTSTKLQPTSGTYSGKSARKVDIVPEDGEVRFRVDGTDPTASVGMPLPLGTHRTLKEYNTLSQARFIRVGASDVTLSVTYYYQQ